MFRGIVITTAVVFAFACSPHKDKDDPAASHFPNNSIGNFNPPYQQATPPVTSIDLTIDPVLMNDTLEIQNAVDFLPGSCAYQEGCVDSLGQRDLLRFSVATINYGESHLELGAPEDNLDLFEFSPCHGHYHLNGFAEYTLSNAAGTVSVGHKQAFCLMDIYPYDNKPAQWFDCENQGISSGWADIYDSSLDCQWIDITDVPPGDYDLTVTVDTVDLFDEIDETNNVVSIPVTIP